MEISQYTKGALLIKGRKEGVFINPHREMEGRMSGVRTVIFENREKNFIGLNSGERVVIWGPGEYEVSGVEVSGLRIGEKAVAYIIHIDGMRVGWMSEVVSELTEKKKERLSECDVLVLKEVGNVKEIWELAKTFGVSYLIVSKISQEDQKKLLDLADQEDVVAVPVLKVEREALPEGVEVVILAET